MIIYILLASGIFNKEVDNEKHAEKAKNKKQKNLGDGDKRNFTNDLVNEKNESSFYSLRRFSAFV